VNGWSRYAHNFSDISTVNEQFDYHIVTALTTLNAVDDRRWMGTNFIVFFPFENSLCQRHTVVRLQQVSLYISSYRRSGWPLIRGRHKETVKAKSILLNCLSRTNGSYRLVWCKLVLFVLPRTHTHTQYKAVLSKTENENS